MTKIVKTLSKTLLVLLVASLAFGGATSCKSKKKLAKEKVAAEYAAKVDQAKKDLTAIINGSTNWTADEMTQRIAKIKSYNIDDPEVQDLIKQAEQTVDELKADELRRAEEERLRQEEEARKSKFLTIDEQFFAIATAGSIDQSNNQIQKTLQEFETPDIPVLIIISKNADFNDYDRPTTISKFLNYLKDKKQYKYEVESVKRNSLGKITELELIVK